MQALSAQDVALHNAIKDNPKNVAKVIKKLIQEGANLNMLSDDFETPLMYALRCKNIEAVLAICEYGGINLRTWKPIDWSALHYAVAYCDPRDCGNIIKKLIAGNADVHAVTEDGESPLAFALRGMKLDTAFALCKYGNIDLSSWRDQKQGWGALHYLIEYDNTHDCASNLERLLKKGLDVNTLSGVGESPVMLALRKQRFDLVEKLLACPDIDGGLGMVDKTHWTTLHYAIEHCNSDNCPGVIQQLILHKANVNALTNEGESPLFFALSRERYSAAVALWTFGELDVREWKNRKNGWTPLHYVIEYSPGRADLLETVQLFLERGADPTAVSANNNETPMMLALRKESFPAVVALSKHKDVITNGWRDPKTELSLLHYVIQLEKPMEVVNTIRLVMAKDAIYTDAFSSPAQFESLLVYALQKRRFEAAFGVCQLGHIDVGNWKDKQNGWTVLHYVSEHSTLDECEDLARRLIGAGANFNALSNEGESPLMVAVRNRKQGVTNVLLENDKIDVNNATASNTEHATLHYALEYCTQSECADVVRRILDKGANVNALSALGESPLMLALRKRKLDVVHILLKHENINITDAKSNITQRTPLHYAIEYSSESESRIIVRQLLDKGADVNALCDMGDSPIMLAVSRSKVDVVEDLLESPGINVNAGRARDTGWTVLHYAVDTCEPGLIVRRFDHERIFRDLLSHGADVNVLSERGESPLAFALRVRNFLAVASLLPYCSDVDIKCWRDGVHRRTALQLAVEFLHSKDCVNPAVRRLLERGADPNAAGKSPLFLAYENGESLKNVQLFKMLLKHGANANVVITDGDSLLSIAISSKNIVAIETLLTHGRIKVRVGPPNYKGRTALHNAIENQLPLELIEVMIGQERCEDLEVRTCLNQSYLELAIEHRREDVALLLIQSGARVDFPITMFGNQLPLDRARLLGCSQKLIDALDPDKVPSESDLNGALRRRDWIMVKALLEEETGAVVVNRTGESWEKIWTILHLYAWVSSDESLTNLKKLFEDEGRREILGIFLNEHSRCTFRALPVHLAAKSGNIGALGFLLSRMRARFYPTPQQLYSSASEEYFSHYQDRLTVFAIVTALPRGSRLGKESSIRVLPDALARTILTFLVPRQ